MFRVHSNITFSFLIERAEEKLTARILIAAIETLFVYPINSDQIF